MICSGLLVWFTEIWPYLDNHSLCLWSLVSMVFIIATVVIIMKTASVIHSISKHKFCNDSAA